MEFKQTPEIVIQRSICGAVFTDEGYRLCLADSIVESIPVSVPQNAGLDVDAQSSGGQVNSEIPVIIMSATSAKSGSLQGKLNGGGPMVKVHTSTGDICIKRAGR